MKTSFFHDLEHLGTTIRWVICMLALFVSCIALAINVNNSRQATTNDLKMCRALLPGLTAANTANKTFHDVIQQSLDAAVKRIGTPKELPGDKALIIRNQKFINKFIVVSVPRCDQVIK